MSTGHWSKYLLKRGKNRGHQSCVPLLKVGESCQLPRGGDGTGNARPWEQPGKNRKRPSETSPQPAVPEVFRRHFPRRNRTRLFVMPHDRPSTAIPYQPFTVRLCIIWAGCFSFPFISVKCIYLFNWKLHSSVAHPKFPCASKSQLHKTS